MTGNRTGKALKSGGRGGRRTPGRVPPALALLLAALWLAAGLAGCSEQSPTPPPGTGGGNGDGDSSSVIDPGVTVWDGTDPARWRDTVTLHGDTVVLEGTGDVNYSSRPIDTRHIASASLHFDLAFEGEAETRALFVETLGWGMTAFGYEDWTNLTGGNGNYTMPGDGYLLQVYDNAWRISGSEIDSIRVRVSGFNENLAVYLVQPRVITD
ncbi:MAG TPA: hypothetical protein ENI92_10050 [Bacteroidetes bacterium]|nr:hypothetical protein [Bacteroidota bacterium]